MNTASLQQTFAAARSDFASVNDAAATHGADSEPARVAAVAAIESAGRLADACISALTDRIARTAAARAGILWEIVLPWGPSKTWLHEIGRITMDTAAARALTEVANLISSLRVDGQIPVFNIGMLLRCAEEAVTLIPGPLPAREPLAA